MRAGDRIEILRKDIDGLDPKKTNFGVIQSISGECVMVRPMRRTWLVELYKNEIRATVAVK